MDVRKWWDTPETAWGLLLIGLGVGGMLTYVSPQAGITVCGVITIAGIFLIIRAYRGKTKYRLSLKEGGNKMLIGLGIFIIIAGIVGGGLLIKSQVSLQSTSLRVEKVIGLANNGWGLQVVNNSTTEVAKDCVGMLDIVECVNPPPEGSTPCPPTPFNANESFSNHALHWANPNIIYPTSPSILEVIHSLYPFQSPQQGMYTWAWENMPSTPVLVNYSLLILIKIDAIDYAPSYTLCLFRHRGMEKFGSLEIVNNALGTRPTIEQCEKMITEYLVEHPN